MGGSTSLLVNGKDSRRSSITQTSPDRWTPEYDESCDTDSFYVPNRVNVFSERDTPQELIGMY